MILLVSDLVQYFLNNLFLLYRAKIDYSKNIELNLKLVKSLPTLIKGYIKLNAYIGDGAVIDYKFKTTDVFVFLPSNKINKEYVEKIV